MEDQRSGHDGDAFDPIGCAPSRDVLTLYILLARILAATQHKRATVGKIGHRRDRVTAFLACDTVKLTALDRQAVGTISRNL